MRANDFRSNVDVIGTICGISDIESFDLPNNSGVLTKRHVCLRDLRCVSYLQIHSLLALHNSNHNFD